MVCDRCIKVVRDELQKLGYHIKSIELGEVELMETQPVNKADIKLNLSREGFELLDDSNSQLISTVKSIVINHVHCHRDGKGTQENFSRILEKEIGKDYSHISTLFSTIEGRTIENFVIQQKIEKVKELLKYGEMTLSEIAFELNYSSLQYLSNQFKQTTGLRPSQFRDMIETGRNQIDQD